MNKLAIAGALVAILALPTACVYMNAASSVATAPARVVTKTMGTDNIITSYERFFDLKAGYEGRLNQVRDSASALATETDANERARLRTEVNAIRQSCRDAALAYNADAAKLNRSVFQDNNLPQTLDVTACEGAA